MMLPTGCGWLPSRTVILQECFANRSPSFLLWDLTTSRLPAACVGLLFFPLSTLPLASLAVLAFGIITITWWLSGIEASFKVLWKHCMISLARRIFSPSIEKGPHKKEWFWQARWHKNILNGPPSSVLLWPQADGLGKQGEGKHVWHLPWDAFSVAPEQVWLAHWEAEPSLRVQIVCDGGGFPVARTWCLCFHTSI